MHNFEKKAFMGICELIIKARYAAGEVDSPVIYINF
jgi:hypothetical protein